MNKAQMAHWVGTMNQRGTTIAYLKKQTTSDQLKKILDIVQHNCETLWRQLAWISSQPEAMRMFRITSDFVPAATYAPLHASTNDPLVHEALRLGLTGIRGFADQHKIRLTMHPGQFTNLCSDNPYVVMNSIDDMNHHALLAKYMGYGDTWHSSGFAINIHANARQDPGLKQIRRVIANHLSNEARNLITLENDEYGCSVDQFIRAGVHEDVALVLDIHHHWINTQGIYIDPIDSRVQAFHESWRGMRPLGHVSSPGDECFVAAGGTTLPDYKALVTAGVSPRDLRKHGSLLWNKEHADWALDHAFHMDLEVEAKSKNVASKALYDYGVIAGYLR